MAGGVLKWVRKGDVDRLEALLESEAGAEDMDKFSKGLTPLMVACEEGEGDVVSCLIHHKADANARESAHKPTALLLACQVAKTCVCRLPRRHTLVDILFSSSLATRTFVSS